jgi:hypothetical protein
MLLLSTSQPAAIDRGQLPPHRFSPAPCTAEHIPVDRFLCPPFGVAFASPSSSVVLWFSPATSMTFPASSPACHRELPSAEHCGKPPMLSHFLPQIGFPPSPTLSPTRCPAFPHRRLTEWPLPPPLCHECQGSPILIWNRAQLVICSGQFWPKPHNGLSFILGILNQANSKFKHSNLYEIR